MMKITILAENLVRRRFLLAEHGLSLWIERDADRVLFDTGQSDVYLKNARVLGIDPAQAQAIVLSHGHYDHGGGLAFFPQEARWPPVYVHPDALEPKYAASDIPGKPTSEIGLPWLVDGMDHLSKHLVLNTATLPIADGLSVCTAIPRVTSFEQVSPTLLVKENGQLAVDDLHDEQVLVCDAGQGLAVILGCSHPGVVNILRHVQALFPGRPIQTVVGGMHLESVDEDRLCSTIDFFRQQDIKTIVPLHCTGQKVIWSLRRSLGERVLIRRAGDEIHIG